MKTFLSAKFIRTFLLAAPILIFASFTLYKIDSLRSGATRATLASRFFQSLEWSWYDAKFRLRPQEQASGVIIAKIDDLSLKAFGRWPWTRARYQELLDMLYSYGAQVVAFDAVFSEPEFQSQALKDYLAAPAPGHAKSLKDLLALKDADIATLSDTLPNVGDQIFSTAVANHPRTVLGYIWQNRDECLGVNMEQAFGTLLNNGVAIEGLAPFETSKPPVASLPVFYCPAANTSVISARARYKGYFNAIPESDGLFRRLHLVTSFNVDAISRDDREWLNGEWFKSASLFPALSLAAVLAYFESPGFKVDADTTNGKFKIKNLIIPRNDAPVVTLPTHPDGSLSLKFYGSQNQSDYLRRPIPEFSLGAIQGDLSDRDFQERYGLDHEKPLKGQIVFVGPTALGVYDLRPSAVQGDGAGVYLHATAAARILERARDGNAVVSMRHLAPGWGVVLLAGLSVVLVLLLTSLRAVQGALGALTLIGLFLLVDLWLFTARSWVLDSVTMSLSLLIIFVAVFVYKYFSEEKDRAFVKGAFEKYVSPDLVGAILKDPKKLNLGGQKKELTVLFSDIRGFTNISEKLEASDLATFMNEYLTPMTEIVIENKGTIDKYMGDAIMAIFGAPVEYEGHAACAVRAAMGMLKKLGDLQVVWAQRGLPSIGIGIGINTGDMSVGNMGSNRIFSYTVMGDAVNLGSRIEGLNKEYGSALIISEFTRAQLPADFECRELDRVRVKGKEAPVKIFEVLALEKLDSSRAARRDHFERALGFYYKQNFAEARQIFANLAPHDPTSGIYAQRCELFLATPPPADWDSTWTMTHK